MGSIPIQLDSRLLPYLHHNLPQNRLPELFVLIGRIAVRSYADGNIIGLPILFMAFFHIKNLFRGRILLRLHPSFRHCIFPRKVIRIFRSFPGIFLFPAPPYLTVYFSAAILRSDAFLRLTVFFGCIALSIFAAFFCRITFLRLTALLRSAASVSSLAGRKQQTNPQHPCKNETSSTLPHPFLPSPSTPPARHIPHDTCQTAAAIFPPVFHPL